MTEAEHFSIMWLGSKWGKGSLDIREHCVDFIMLAVPCEVDGYTSSTLAWAERDQIRTKHSQLTDLKKVLKLFSDTIESIQSIVKLFVSYEIFRVGLISCRAGRSVW